MLAGGWTPGWNHGVTDAGAPLKIMSDTAPTQSVERLFPFVLKSRALIVGRDTLVRSKGRLHFVLITTDISENGREQILKDFAHYPIVQHYTESELAKYFRINGAKVVGFTKSGLAQSIYAELKAHRINQQVMKSRPPGPPLPPKARKTR